MTTPATPATTVQGETAGWRAVVSPATFPPVWGSSPKVSIKVEEMSGSVGRGVKTAGSGSFDRRIVVSRSLERMTMGRTARGPKTLLTSGRTSLLQTESRSNKDREHTYTSYWRFVHKYIHTFVCIFLVGNLMLWVTVSEWRVALSMSVCFGMEGIGSHLLFISKFVYHPVKSKLKWACWLAALWPHDKCAVQTRNNMCSKHAHTHTYIRTGIGLAGAHFNKSTIWESVRSQSFNNPTLKLQHLEILFFNDSL